MRKAITYDVHVMWPKESHQFNQSPVKKERDLLFSSYIHLNFETECKKILQEIIFFLFFLFYYYYFD